MHATIRRSVKRNGAFACWAIVGAGLLASRSLATEPCCPCIGDFDATNMVDGADLGLLLAAWGSAGGPCQDLDANGVIDGADLGLLLAAWGPCPPPPLPTCGDPCAGSCNQPHASPACNDAEICACVCTAEPACCNTVWDLSCANLADLCPFPQACTNATHDCFDEGDGGCNDAGCCALVCSIDSFCCEVAWDGICVGEAMDICDNVPTTGCRQTDHSCFQTGAPGCSDADCCAAVCSQDSACCEALWDLDCVALADKLCSEPPQVCATANHDCCTQGSPGCTDSSCCGVVCAVDSTCCDQNWDGACVVIALNLCGPCPVGCGKTQHSCFDFGLSGCDDAACCEKVCEVDPSCCATGWDFLCIKAAFELCSLCPMSNQDCCDAWPGPYCNDPVCCTLVCGFDAYCCEQAWDSLCALQAAQMCDVACPSPCAVDNPQDCFYGPLIGLPGCNDVTCCTYTCAVDPFCCETEWDGICAAEAICLCLSPCELECADTPELEACGEDSNGGCDQEGVPHFEPIACGQTICGAAFISGAHRDIDWYRLDLSRERQKRLLIASLEGESPARLEIRTGPCGEFVEDGAEAEHCDAVDAVACVSPGVVWIVVSPTTYANRPCDAVDTEYHVSVSCGDPCTSASDCCYPTGTTGCGDAACEEAVCDFDSFCCFAGWDLMCAQEAQELCPTLCGG